MQKRVPISWLYGPKRTCTAPVGKGWYCHACGMWHWDDARAACRNPACKAHRLQQPPAGLQATQTDRRGQQVPAALEQLYAKHNKQSEDATQSSTDGSAAGTQDTQSTQEPSQERMQQALRVLQELGCTEAAEALTRKLDEKEPAQEQDATKDKRVLDAAAAYVKQALKAMEAKQQRVSKLQTQLEEATAQLQAHKEAYETAKAMHHEALANYGSRFEDQDGEDSEGAEPRSTTEEQDKLLKERLERQAQKAFANAGIAYDKAAQAGSDDFAEYTKEQYCWRMVAAACAAQVEAAAAQHAQELPRKRQATGMHTD